MQRGMGKKTSIFFVLCLIASWMLVGCMPTFDASGYVKACLDANTKGEFEQCAEITGTTIEEIEALYNKRIDQEMSYIDVYAIGDEKKDAFRQLFIDLFKSVQYEVGEATRNEDDSYTVPVTTHKLMLFEGVMDEWETHLNNYAQAEVDAGRTPTQEQLEIESMNYLYDMLKARLEKATYAEPVTINVSVTPTKNGSEIIYSIDSNQLQSLIESLIDVENAG